MLTFAVSLLWIAFFSYMLVWWATIVGDMVGIPTVIMGYTFLAAGTSIPDGELGERRSGFQLPLRPHHNLTTLLTSRSIQPSAPS